MQRPAFDLHGDTYLDVLTERIMHPQAVVSERAGRPPAISSAR